MTLSLPMAGRRSTSSTRIWLAFGASQLGTRVMAVSLPVVAVKSYNATAFHMGLLGASSSISYAALALPAGVWVERWDKRRTMASFAMLRVATVVTLVAAWVLEHRSIFDLLVASTVIGAASVFFDLASLSLMPEVTPADRLVQANSRIELSSQLSRLAGPAVAGLLLSQLSGAVVMLIDAFAYLLCLIALRGLVAARLGEKAPVRRHFREELVDGVRFVSRERSLRLLALCMASSSFFATGVIAMTPYVVLKRIGLSSSALGVILSAGAVGGLLGALTLPKVRFRVSASRTMFFGLAVATLGTALLPLAASIGQGCAAIQTGGKLYAHKRPFSLDAAEKAAIDLHYRTAAKKAHPDTGGSTEAMAELNAAKAEALKECGDA